MRKLLLSLFKALKGHTLDIGSFSNWDLVLIILLFIRKLFRGIPLALIFKSPVFLGRRSIITGLNNIRVMGLQNYGDNVKICAIGSTGFILGDRLTLRSGVTINALGSLKASSGRLEIGKNVGFSDGCLIEVRGNISIGDNAIFGPGVKIFSENHGTKVSSSKVPFNLQEESRKSVSVGVNVWVGANAVILAGSKIPDNTIIAANSVVTGDLVVPGLYTGSPATLKKTL